MGDLASFVPILGLAPDADPTIEGVLTACIGVVPSLKGMKGAPSPADAGMATLSATCQGAAAVYKLDGSYRIFAGTQTKVYETNSSVWSDVSPTATLTGGVNATWRFAQQDNVTLAVNGADTVMASVSTGAFSVIGGAPIASVVEVVNKFVFVANTSVATNQIRWSAEGDYTSWAASVTTGAGSDTLTSTPGAITAVKRFGSVVLVFKRGSIYIGQFNGTGSGIRWTFTPIPGPAGAITHEVVVDIGTSENPKLVFMGDGDFYYYDGSNPVSIGTNRIKESVFGSILQSRYSTCKALHDRKNTRVYFFYPTTDISLPDACVVYNYRTDKWGRDDRRVEACLDWVSPSLTYGGVGSLYSTYANLPTLDYGTAFLGNNQIQPAVIDSSHIVKTLTAAAGTTSFTTGDLGQDKQLTCVTGVWPRFVTRPTSATITNFTRMKSGESLTTDQTISINSDDGAFNFVREARWHRFQFNFVGDWEMSGYRPEGALGGDA